MVHTLLPLVTKLRPRCVAMCGVCAGRRDKVALGDVVAADRVYYHDTGKLAAARSLLEQVLASDLKTFGEDHPTVATRRHNLAVVLKGLGELPAARSH